MIQSMNKQQIRFRSYFFRTITVQGYEIITAGLYRALKRPDTSLLENNLHDLQIRENALFETDYQLARAVVEGGKEIFQFVGACLSADIAGIHSTGGIIGNPNSEINSSEGELENMGDGFLMLSYSGSPGVLFRNRREIQQSELVDMIRLSSKKADAGEALSHYLLQAAPNDPFIVVCDGCNRAGGYIAVYDGNYHFDSARPNLVLK